MPAIVAREDIDAWLNPESLIATALGLLKPFPAGAMESHAVPTLVNSVQNDGPSLIEHYVPSEPYLPGFNFA
jgi:putative SOS response-associated peptidase YedK